jgi:hypothetical protein
MTERDVDIPNWNSAPVWATYTAQDLDSEWNWYESKPFSVNAEDNWLSVPNTMYTQAEPPVVDMKIPHWHEMIFPRPTLKRKDDES